ncbi:MAG: hypothetical protein K1Y02_02570 [Candidatus Hydrogenedentes bacterium]|nr:hypothetical protein [Candidatus Hydrogenedentota bacterium]
MLPTLLLVVTVSASLPMGWSPEPAEFQHFPDRLHAYVWRNWTLVPTERLATVVGTKPEDIVALGKAMGLSDPPSISDDQLARTYITIIRRNWHLLPYEQIAELLKWPLDQLDYTLREGDGLLWWMGGYKPKLDPLRYSSPDAAAKAREAEIARIISEVFPNGVDRTRDPLFSFIDRLSSSKPEEHIRQSKESIFTPRYCFSYFGAFRDPLNGKQDPYPNGYLDQLAARGIDGVWLHEPLYHLAPFPWDPALSEGNEARLGILKDLVARARERGIGIYLYMNEPRPMPMSFFEKHPELKGVDDTGVIAGQVATLCTSVPEVAGYLRDGISHLCKAVPDLAGIFTITASENYTNCWSHMSGDQCPRCSKRAPEEVIAEVNTLMAQGIAESGSSCRLIVWDWGWKDEWAEGIINRLPKNAALQSVSEWSLPITRGGISSTIGEYSLSTIGPGPRALRHWEWARKQGLQTIAKIQAGTCWEIGSVPYIPAVENVAQHVANLRDTGINGLMMSWTLGGYPSVNMEAAIEMGRRDKPSVDDALMTVATRCYGASAAPAIVRAWKGYSAALREYPFSTAVLYNSPVHMGPANLLWDTTTSYRERGATGFAYPFDAIDFWRGPYPPEVFAAQFGRVASGFRDTLEKFKFETGKETNPALTLEAGIAEASAANFQSVANQTWFVIKRDQLIQLDTWDANPGAKGLLDSLEEILKSEIALASRLRELQSDDSRIGFEAACQYFFVNVDLGEKVLNCRDLLERWIPEQRKKLDTGSKG